MNNISLEAVKIQISAIFLLFLLILVTGCATQMPDTTTSHNQSKQTYIGSYNKVWRVVLAALQSEDINMNVVDKESGIINGVKNLVPSTMDMLTHYSARVLINITVQIVGNNNIEVSIRSKAERKYEGRGWRPSYADASPYSEALYNKINKELVIKSDVRNAKNSSSTLRDEKVRSAQTKLQYLGYKPGVADGIMGRKTSQAITAFQRDSGITLTGALDAKTKAALKNASRKTSPAQNNASINPVARDVPSAVPSNKESIRQLRLVEEAQLKAAAGPYSDTKAILRRGQLVKILSKSGQWYKVRADGIEGYVYADFVQ